MIGFSSEGRWLFQARRMVKSTIMLISAASGDGFWSGRAGLYHGQQLFLTSSSPSSELVGGWEAGGLSGEKKT